MKTFFHRASLATCVVAFGVLSAAIGTASADTGPWAWSDASSQVSIRSNRPVWAVAHSESGWFYTDGQDLATTGHVWHTDGYTASDVTADVRSAGLTRVDDIVSDGNAVLFLKNVNTRSNAAEVLEYNTTYVNRTDALRKTLLSDEGIVTITGKNGQWGIVTSRGRALLWNPGQSVTRVVQDLPKGIEQTPYAQRHASPADGFAAFSVALQPMTNGWLLVARNQTTGLMRFTKATTDGATTDVTELFGNVAYVHALSSNGSAVLIAGSADDATRTSRVLTFDGTFVKDVSTAAISLQLTNWNRILSVWNGKSWIILAGKNLFRFDNSEFQVLGQTTDLFTSIAGDGKGTFFLGGAASAAHLEDIPTSPLTAKLTKVVEEGTTAAYWTWLEPTMSILSRNQTTSYRLGAWHPDGIKSIDIFVNWGLRKTCQYASNDAGNKECAVPLVGSEFPSGKNIVLVAKIISTNDRVTWTSFQQLPVKDSAFALALNTNPVSTESIVTSAGVTVWSWLDPNISSLNRYDALTFKSEANATNGLIRIDLYVNGALKKMCDFARAYGTQNCEVGVSGTDYALGTTVPVNAKATSANGDVSWTATRLIEIRDNLKDAGRAPATVSGWISPTKDSIRDNEPTTFFGTAQDQDGLTRIDLIVDGIVKQSCSFTNAYTTHECSMPIDAKQFPDRQSLNLTVRATDAQGYVTLSDSKNVSLWH